MEAQLLDSAPYSLSQQTKQVLLFEALKALTEHHRANCAEYALVAHKTPATQLHSLADFPFLTVSLFKQRELRSIPKEKVFKVLQSSGTTGQTPSRIYLDADTAKLQSRVLVKIMQEWLGKQRRHMLIWDHPNVIQDRASFSARGAGIQGLSFLGRDHTYALNDDMTLNIDAIRDFYERFGDKPVLMFGFTFMVWKYGVQALAKAGVQLNFEDAVLLHSGGWKKLQDEAVSAQTFNQTVAQHLGSISVHNFYGMVEQVGSVFVECEEGHLHCPNTADVIIRDPQTWQVLGEHREGIIQVVSALPHSYPGHSLLTEDRGRLLGEDNCSCGRSGKYFEVLGRLPKVEARGCSDTFEGSTK